MLLIEYAIELWFIIPPLLTNVSALPMETWTRKLSFQYATGMCLLLENVGGCVHAGRPEVVTLNICNWPVPFRATHILQEKTHACGVLKRHNIRVHVSLGSAETLVRRGGIINHHSMAYSLSNISAKNYRNRLMWFESIVCNISVVFYGTQCTKPIHCFQAQVDMLNNHQQNRATTKIYLMWFTRFTRCHHVFTRDDQKGLRADCMNATQTLSLLNSPIWVG